MAKKHHVSLTTTQGLVALSIYQVESILLRPDGVIIIETRTCKTHELLPPKGDPKERFTRLCSLVYGQEDNG